MRKRRRKSGSKWLALAAAAVLAAVAWNAYRTPTGPAAGDPAASAGTSGTRVTTALELPPPMPVGAPAARDPRYPGFLPAEAIGTLRLIQRGGPYPHRQDDGAFANREGRLPPKPRGYYREYTVETPGSPDRGARRIVAGGQPPVEYFYTDDHYRSFRRFTLDGGAASGTAPDGGQAPR